MGFEPRERRRDRRLEVTGQAALRVLTRPGPEIFGGVVDVGAGGARVRVRPGADVFVGDRVHVDLEVPMPKAPPELGPVRLFGRGEVVRLESDVEGGLVPAIRFDGPLRVADTFAVPVRVPRASRVA